MSTQTILFDSTPGQVPVRGTLHAPEHASGDALVLTHGAGADSNAPLLRALAEAFCEAGMTVLRCDLPFRQLRPHGPPMRGSAERDQQGLRRAVELLRKMVSGNVYLGGHSYGGRQASMLAASDPEVAKALLLLSYPLHPPKKPEQMRTEHFSNLKTSTLFVHGVRDGFATSEELRAAIRVIPAKTELLDVEKAGHELLSKTNRAELTGRVVEAFRRLNLGG